MRLLFPQGGRVNRFVPAVRAFAASEGGQDLVEYALIVAAVGLAVIGTVQTLATEIYSLYSSIIVRIAGTGLTPPQIDWY